jgi:hypothetical protein
VAAAPQPAPAPVQNTPQPDKKAEKAQAAQDAARQKAEIRARRRQEEAEARQAKAAPAQPQRQPVFDTPAAPPPAVPAPAPAPALVAPPPAPVAPVAVAPAAPVAAASTEEPAGAGIIVFANLPGTRCGACETVKISVQPSGKVLIERGHGAQESWRYRRSLARTRPERAAAFAARLAALRPQGKQDLTCAAPTTQDQGVSVEWIEGDRHDQLTIAPGCGNASLATLMQAPDLLDLHQLVFPWAAAR